MTTLAKPIIDNLVSQGIEYVVDSSGEAFVMLDKAQLYHLIRAAGLAAIPPFLYQVDDSPRDTWVPSRDDSEVNPGTGAAKKNDNYKSTPAKPPKTVKPETLLQSLQTFAGAIIAKGFATGGARYNPNKDRLLGALTPFISALARGLKIDNTALGLLLVRIEAYLA